MSTKVAEPAWRAKTSLFEKKYVTRTIGSAEWNFYPVRLARLFQLRETIRNICAACSTLFAKAKDDCGQEIEKITSHEGTIERNTIQAIAPELAKLREQQRRQGMMDSVDALLGDQNRIALGRLIADSLRDEFPANPTDQDIQAFLDTLDLAQMVEMLMGFAEANAQVFGPLGEKMRAAMKQRLDALLPSAALPVGAPAPSTPAS